MPSLSPTMTEGSIVAWQKKEGDEVCSGDVLCEVQTDKAVVALETDEEGVMAKILAAANTPNIKVGDLIAVIASPGEDWKEVAASVSTTAAPPPSKPTVADIPAAAPTAAPASTAPPSPAAAPVSCHPTQATHPTSLGPAVRQMLLTHNLDAKQIPATGPHGQLLKGDVLAYLAGHPSGAKVEKTEGPLTPSQRAGASLTTTAAAAGYIDLPLTNMRLTIAKRLTESKSSIPHRYLRAICCLDAVSKLRHELKERCHVKISVNDFVIKACAIALRLVPGLNAISDAATGTVKHLAEVDISVAVATPSGLITPILRGADRLPITELSRLANQLAKKARDGKLQPAEFMGGSFSISNLGMFGIRDFTAIINLPQVAILAVGAGHPIPSLSSAFASTIETTNHMTVTLSTDSRFVDEMAAGRFLQHVSDLLAKHPEMLLSDDVDLRTQLEVKSGGKSSVQLDDFDLTMWSTYNAPSLPM